MPVLVITGDGCTHYKDTSCNAVRIMCDNIVQLKLHATVLLLMIKDRERVDAANLC